MKKSGNYIINVLAVSFFTLILLSVLLFWGRKLVQVWVHELKGNGTIKIQPSGLLPQLEVDPNVVQQSSVSASLVVLRTGEGLGIMRYFTEKMFNARHRPYPLKTMVGNRYFLITEETGEVKGIYFDENIKRFVYCSIRKQMVSDESKWQKQIHLYAGPDGISSEPDAKIGKFSGSFLYRFLSNKRITIYDKELRRFFQISFDKETAIKGPKLGKNYQPTQMDIFGKPNINQYFLSWSSPMKKADVGSKQVPIRDDIGTNIWGLHIILDESGYIYMLNPNTLRLEKRLGFLPSAPPFGDGTVAKPDNLFAYNITPRSLAGEYTGLAVGTISREGNGLAVSVFGPNGRRIKQQTTFANPEKHPGGPLLMVTRYILGNLQAPILGITSFLTASSFEATAGHRALFILPESYVGWFGRDKGEAPVIVRFLGALIIILPSILLALSLAWRVKKDSFAVGFSKQARRWWFWSTVAFGLSVYISYRLTRPKEALVTCINCGRLRRPDMDSCHLCGSGWVVPELTPPDWRVVDSQ